MIISKTPLRISFAGGGTDIPSFYRNNNFGAVLSTSIDSYLYVIIKKHSLLHDEKIRLNYSETERVDDIESIKNPIVREVLKFLGIDDRIYIATIADAPTAAGLGSSSSFTVGLLNALYRFKGVKVSQAKLAEDASHIEIDILKKPVGKQDQYAAAIGGINLFTFYDNDTVSIKPIHLNSISMQRMFDSIISFWTGVSRPSEMVLGEQEKKNTTSQSNINLLLSMRSQTEDLQRLFKAKKFEIKNFGEVLHKGWEMKKKLASNISNSSIDKYISIAKMNGAIGGKLSGAGGGGFLSFIAHKKNQKNIINALLKEGLIPYKFNLDTYGSLTNEIL